MFLSRRVLSLGLRTTLKCLQDNITSMQSLRNPILPIQQNNFSLSSRLSTVDKDALGAELLSESSALDRQKLGELFGKMKLTFTCKKCNTRNRDKIISKIAYTKGAVIVRCDGCKNNHLIADNLGWFGTPGRNIEFILNKKGETVRRFRDDLNGYYEVILKEEALKLQEQMRSNDNDDVKISENDKETVKLEYGKVGQDEEVAQIEGEKAEVSSNK